jgi:MFS family permease
MSDTNLSPQNARSNRIVFWGCFIALITTSFAFITRMYLCDVRFGTDFGIDKVAIGALKGAGVWPFAISIILFSLVIDRIGYRVAMFFSFACYVIYLALAWMAYGAIDGVEGAGLAAAQERGHNLLYWGSIILGLGNGTVEAFINPLVASMFSKEKTKWLNILHAGWPGGLVIAGMITIAMSGVAKDGDWRMVLGIIAIPAVIYVILLATAKFPLSEAQQAGVSYREMLAEFGGFGALVGFGLIFMQLGEVFKWPLIVSGVLTAIVTAVFAIYTGSFGRGILAFLIIIMMPLATTEIGTDGWIMGLMEEPMKQAGFNAGWVLVYTSAIMMVLRFFAGPIVHKLSPIGLLITSSILAIGGLFALSKTGNSGLGVIFAAATLYGFGKTFFWPTMLGITAEQCPKGGALTLNAISGIGMIAVGVLGFPYIGFVQERTASSHLSATAAPVAANVLTEKSYMGVPYKAIDSEVKVDAAATTAIAEASKAGQFNALAIMSAFPAFMLLCYFGMFAYFKSKGGYKAVNIEDLAADEVIAAGAKGATF